MTELLTVVVNMSAAASVVAIAAMLVRLSLKKAPKVFSYALWLTVFLRLICPFSFESPASLMPSQPGVLSPAMAASTAPQISGGMSVVDEPLNLFTEGPLPQTDAAAGISPAQAVLTIGAYLWLCGVILMVFYAVASYIRVKRQVYDATLIQDNIFETDKISTAFVLGFTSPKIYLPTGVRGRQFDYILRHEQVHIRRCDHLIKPFAFLILAVHWFNPIVWFSYYLMSKDMEMSCDEAVLQRSGADIRQDYSASLINLYTEKPRLLSPLAFGEGSYQNMKERIKNVLHFQKAPRWAVAVCSLMLMLFMAGFATQKPNAQPAASVAPETGERYSPIAIKWEALPGYEQFGISYNSNNEMLFNGQLVRYFFDGYEIEHGVLATHYDYLNKNGTVDAHTVRSVIDNRDGSVDMFGELKDIVAYSQQEFEERDIHSLNRAGASPVTAIADRGRASNTAGKTFAEKFAEYGAFGVEFTEKNGYGGNGNVSYQGQAVQTFVDEKPDGSVFMYSSIDGGDVVIRTVYDDTGKLIAVASAQKAKQNSNNQYALYEQYGLTYRVNEDKLYYKGQPVRYFIDRYNDGQGILSMWAYDLDGTVDLHTIRNNAGLQGELTGLEAYSQEDFNLRTKEIEAQKNNIPNYDVLTFRFRKSEAPDSLRLWIRECEDSIFDFMTTEQNGRYYIYVRGETEFGFSGKVDGDEASMEIFHIDGVQGEGYALFSVPLYRQFTVTYNGTTQSFLQ